MRLTGDIFLQSSPGFGSTFTFYVQAESCSCPPDIAISFPKPSSPFGAISTPRTHQTIASGPDAEELKPQRKLRVLLTEDNLINQQLLRRQLTKAGCIVFVANNGKEALDFIVADTSPLDCILMGMYFSLTGGRIAEAQIF